MVHRTSVFRMINTVNTRITLIYIFHNYDILYRTNYSSLTTNFVFKWEYKQGSNLYFVYSLYKDVSGESLDDLLD